VPPKKKLTLGARITAGRERLGLNRNQFAAKAGLPYRTLVDLETDHSTASGPGLTVLQKVAAALNVPMGDLLD
jgi:transcriptional regulator with XRE-family HTH domain